MSSPRRAVTRKVFPNGLGGRCAQAHNDGRLHRSELRIEPGPAGGNFAGAGFLVDAALAARLPFEMFRHIGHIDFFAVNAGFDQGSVQKSPGRPDKGFAAQIFVVPRLLTNQHDLRARAAFAENSLSRIFPRRTIATALSLSSQFFKRLCKKVGLLFFRLCQEGPRTKATSSRFV